MPYLHSLCLSHDRTPAQDHRTELPDLPVYRVPAHLQ